MVSFDAAKTMESASVFVTAAMRKKKQAEAPKVTNPDDIDWYALSKKVATEINKIR